MTRATTIVETWQLDADLRNCKVFATYQQEGVNIIEKTEADMEITEDTIEYTLTQEETARLSDESYVSVQLRWVDSKGNANATDIIRRDVDSVLKDGVISWDE